MIGGKQEILPLLDPVYISWRKKCLVSEIGGSTLCVPFLFGFERVSQLHSLLIVTPFFLSYVLIPFLPLFPFLSSPAPFGRIVFAIPVTRTQVEDLHISSMKTSTDENPSGLWKVVSFRCVRLPAKGVFRDVRFRLGLPFLLYSRTPPSRTVPPILIVDTSVHR